MAALAGLVGWLGLSPSLSLAAPPGMIASWALNEGVGTIADDGSGNGNIGALTGGPVWQSATNCKVGPCLSFDGVSSRVDIPNSPSLNTTSGFTVALWYQAAANTGSIASKPLGTGSLNSWQLEFLDSSTLSFTSSDSLAQTFDTIPASPAGTWTFVTASWDGTTKKLYLDGVERLSAARLIAFDTSPVVIGGDYNSGLFVLPFGGSVDEIKIFDRALTPAEILALYQEAASALPVISSFTASPAFIIAGEASTLSWSVSGATSLTIDQGIGDVTAATSSVVSPGATTTYTVTATNSGGAVTQSVTVTVSAAGAPGAPGVFEETVYAAGLNTPTAMEFAPDGRLFVAEKAGKLRVIKNGVLLPAPFVTLNLESTSERGLLGVAFDPNFAANGFVYVYYTRAQPTVKNRVSRFTASAANPDVAEPGSEVVILDEIASDTGNHNGGATHFGLDGKLYVAVGDSSVSSNAPSLSTLSGKLLRINPDGTVPPDNPFVGVAGARPEIWAFGLRNPFTSAVDPVDGRIYVNDVGNGQWEEVNVGIIGANYGWPSCEGPQGTGLGTCTNPAFTYPIHAYTHAVGQAITGGAFYRKNQFPSEYDGSYFFSDYLGGWIKRLDVNGQLSDFRTATSPVDIKIGPDGSLYYLSIFTGSVFKVTFVTSNRSPVASFTANPTSGLPPLTVSFDAASSSDPDGNPLTYTWNFGDGSAPATGVTTAHTYTAAGPYTATLIVNDGQGGTDSAMLVISVGTPPVAVINNPVTGTFYNAGDTVLYSGSGTDADDGTLPASAFSWTILFHHDNHTHPFLGPIAGVTGGSFQISQAGEASPNTWYRIHLTVTDSTGLSQEVTRDITPRKATLTLAANIPGISLTLDGQPGATPLAFESVVGFLRTIGAPSPQFVGNIEYRFVAWSDGGAATHQIQTSATATTYTALYEVVPTLFSANFNSGPDSFVYQDDAFRGTSQPAYASGANLLTGGFTGGALSVQLGGINDATILNMSGGWSRTFAISSPASLTLVLRYNLTQTPNYETDESSQMLVSLDGQLFGTAPNDYIAQVAGDGNGGPSVTTGWQLLTVTFPNVAAGTHTLRIGGFNNKKTFNDESTEVLIDDVVVTGAAPPPLASISVTPASASVAADGTQQYTAQGLDQFGSPVSLAPVWSVTGGGTIDQTGLFTAGSTAGGPFTVTASQGAVSGTASVSISSALIDAHFTTTTDAFVYQDDAFRGTAQPAYASGTHILTGGFTGGALRVFLGGLDDATITNMSGGWSRSFTLASPAMLMLTLRYNLTQSPHYEADENSQMLVSLDGQLYGMAPNDYLARVVGDGNGGPSVTTGWQLVTVTIPNVTAGTHMLKIGGFNNKKTLNDESTEVLIDDVVVTGAAPAPPANQAPTISSTPVLTATVGLLYTYQVTATDPNAGDVLTFSLTTAPTGMTINPTTGVITWTPTAAQAPSQAVTVRATDGGGLFDTQSYSITVAATPPAPAPPVITSTPILTTTVGVIYTHQVTATDANGGPFIFSLDVAPAGMTISATGLISWTPTAAQVSPPTHPVTVRVTDNTALFTTQSYSITVSAAGGGVTLIEAHFDVNEDGFVFERNVFRTPGAADTVAYESGIRRATGGFTGGALSVALGGIDNFTRTNMSGGWSRSFTLASPATLTLTLRYNLTQSPHYEADENSQMLVSLDGQLYGTAPNDFVARVVGNGNGGPSITTGWQLVTVTIPNVAAGTHTLRIGGFNNQKTARDESTEVLVDDVLLIGN